MRPTFGSSFPLWSWRRRLEVKVVEARRGPVHGLSFPQPLRGRCRIGRITSFLLLPLYHSFACGSAELCMDCWGQPATRAMGSEPFSEFKSNRDQCFELQRSRVPAPSLAGASTAVSHGFGWIHKKSDLLGLICREGSDVLAKQNRQSPFQRNNWDDLFT